MNTLFRVGKTVLPILLAHLPHFLLAFGLGGVIALAAADPACSKVELGTFGEILGPGILRLKTLEGLLFVGLFYLLAGTLMAVTGNPLMLRRAQRMIIQPILTPVLFQIAGIGGGMGAPQINQGDLLPLGFPISTVLFALFAHHAYEFLREPKQPVAVEG